MLDIILVPLHALTQDLRNLYTNESARLNNIDFFTGAVVAGNDNNGIPEVFRRIILQQFERIRNGDRFWFENG